MVIPNKKTPRQPKEMTVLELLDEWDYQRQQLCFDISDTIRRLLARRGITMVLGDRYVQVNSVHFKLWIPRDKENNLDFINGVYSNPKVLGWRFPLQ